MVKEGGCPGSPDCRFSEFSRKAVLLGDGRGVAKGGGTGKGRGKGKAAADRPLAWGKLLEMAPLVERFPDDHAERWSVLSPEVEAAGKAWWRRRPRPA